ncbi:hypothetical protein [Sandarakinorhabdus sp.]|uniref:hypothetical protein n=1 Tax=Sandarakinorhabdus sp. TaxID=1916663 RepID=UPI003340D5C2
MRPPSTMIVISAVAAACALAAPANAAEKLAQPPPAVVRKLLDCRSLTDTAQRLACLDTGVAALAEAVEKRDVLVADREQVKAARRGLFGIALPSFKLFGDGKADGEDTDDQGALKQIEAKLTSARAGAGGNWRLVLDDGSIWVQTDGGTLARDPRPGMPIRIRRAAVGSYLANIDGQIAVRVRRINE